jgi:hypothetical protein
MDDTVLQSEVTSFLRAARMVPARERAHPAPLSRRRRVLPGARPRSHGSRGESDLLRVQQSVEPLRRDRRLSRAQRIPQAAAAPRLGLRKPTSGHARHKGLRSSAKSSIVSRVAIPARGDSGQEDPRSTRMLCASAGRVEAVYIRNVSSEPGAERAHSGARSRGGRTGRTLVLADDTLAVARHACMHGWIASVALDEIGARSVNDERRGRARKRMRPALTPSHTPDRRRGP